MANQWIPEQGRQDGDDPCEAASFDEALAIVDDGEGEETRYALTALGVATLARRGTFAGFGPCVASAGPSPDPVPAHRERLRRSRGTRSTPLFG